MNKRKCITIRIDLKTYEEFQKKVKSEDTTMSSVIYEAIQKYLKKGGIKK